MASNYGFKDLHNNMSTEQQPQFYPNAPPSYQESQYNQQQVPMNREALFRNIVQKYEINRKYSDRLQILQGFKIVFIFDDSGSMKSSLNDSPLNKNNSIIKATRWDELKYFADISLEIASLFSQDGSDVYFLNKGLVKNIKNSSQLTNYFQSGPSGYTPITNTFNSILASNIEAIKEKKLLIILVTDGEPTDTSGNVNIKDFKRCLKNRTPIDRIFVTIVACTDEDTSIDYLNRWDREIKNLDVVDDYRNERTEVRRANGNNVSFSYGDYVVKSLIGSIDSRLDRTDEFKCVLI